MRKYTRQTAKMIFRMEMEPCPACGSYYMMGQTPIKMDISDDDLENPKKLLGKWARATKAGATPLKGPVFMMCRDCGYKGPEVDCSGRTSESVGQDPVVAKKIKTLWNENSRALAKG